MSVVVTWALMAVWIHGEDVQSKPKLFYMNLLCHPRQGRRLGIQINDRKAIRIAPWDPPSQVPPIQTCAVPVWSHRYQNYRLSTTFKKVDMSHPSSSGLCIKARLDLYNGNTTMSAARLSGTDGICGKYAKKEYYSTTRNILTMEFMTGNNDKNKYEYFEAIITPFHTGHCQDDEFKCKNGRCVYRDLFCDGYNNCGDNSDESSCKKLLLSIAAIIGIVVGCVVVIGIIVTVVVCKCCCAVCGYERF